MRCVSYTRTTSCKEDGKIPADIIKQQDQHIQEYLKKQFFLKPPSVSSIFEASATAVKSS